MTLVLKNVHINNKRNTNWEWQNVLNKTACFRSWWDCGKANAFIHDEENANWCNSSGGKYQGHYTRMSVEIDIGFCPKHLYLWKNPITIFLSLGSSEMKGIFKTKLETINSLGKYAYHHYDTCLAL